MALEKHFNPAQFEKKHYETWEERSYFTPNMAAEESFAIMMPPPNVTGTLHLGHALDNTLPDILVRRARMQGKAAVYQPGTDHASIAVHVVLERKWAQEGKTRFDMGREEFMHQAWEWKNYSHGVITSQMRRLGVSCDWSNERFTMDEKYSKAVQKVFVDLHKKGLIYRGQRLVNWDPKMQTAVSDLEVKHKEVEGHLWHFKYPYADGFTYADKKTGQADGIVIATTRPETILADGAIAINPEDPRAKSLVGKFVMVPIVNRRIPIVADNYVDPEFGSGMVKITAAHDFNDFEVYKRHKDSAEIPLINLMTDEAKMNENCPPEYQGLDRFAARSKIIEDFKSLNLFVKEQPHTHQVPTAERDDTILEPYLTNQWFVKGEKLAQMCLDAANNKELEFVNERDNRVYHNWLENIQDWCVSRQLWWGHRIPAWYRGEEVYVGEEAPKEEGWQQDEDILDTWFSSALWPFATQGWPEETDRLKKFYPGNVIMTGRDILFFWDTRMMMMGLTFQNQVPFKKIYTHGMILDEHGKKMSKSKGNVIDPMGLIEEYGADAVRFTMASIASAEDMRLSVKKIEQFRNFCTKLWNAARYAEMQEISYSSTFNPATAQHPVNQWVLGEMGQLVEEVDSALDAFRFNDAAAKLYHFTWNIWCDWYLELTKPLLNGEDKTLAEETKATMGWAFEQLLRLLNPVMPFITEELWQNLTTEKEKSLMVQAWPTVEQFPSNKKAAADVNWLVNVVGAVRQARSENKVPPKARIHAFCRSTTAEDEARLSQFADTLASLAGLENITPRQHPAEETDATAVAEGFELILPLEGVVDFAAEKERIQREIEKLEAEAAKIEGMLGNENFVARAPADVVSAQQQRKQAIVADLAKLKSQ